MELCLRSWLSRIPFTDISSPWKCSSSCFVARDGVCVCVCSGGGGGGCGAWVTVCLDSFIVEVRQDEDVKEDLFVFIDLCDATRINGH